MPAVRANSSRLTLKRTVAILKISSASALHLLAAGLLLTLTGCASVSVKNIAAQGKTPRKLPSRIFVQEFTAPYDNFRVDREGKEFLAFVQSERHALALALVEQLSKYIAPAEILPEGTPVPLAKGNYWLVRGTYGRVNQGSRLLRAGVGFGAGGTKMETQAQIADISGFWSDPFLTLFTTGGSGLAPGAWAAFTPAFVFFWPGAVANAGGAAFSGISIDRKRTAREITATLSEYCFQHGLIPGRRMRRPKKLGLLPAFQRPDFVVPKTGP